MSAGRPTREQLRAYLLGRVTPEEQGAISVYLDAHPGLIDHLTEADTSDDSLLAELRHSAAGFMSEAEFHRGLKVVSAIGPTSRPAEAIQVTSGDLPLVGPYRLLERINRRGLSVVWRATDTRDGTAAAVKLLPAARLQDPASLARFRREMDLVASLDHPNIVRCLGCGETDGVPYLAMEMLEGCDLSDLVRRQGPLSIGAATAVARQAALALDCVHRHHMVHRDVKPSNLFLTKSGTVKLLDLGLARCLRAEDDSLTHAEQLLGTMDYMAPEQAFDSSQADIRSDIYSLGCTLYKLLTGNAPFVGGVYQNVLRKALAHASRPMPDIRAIRPDVPNGLAAIIRRMCAKDPAERPSSAIEVADAFLPWINNSHMERVSIPSNTRELSKTIRKKKHGYAILPNIALIGFLGCVAYLACQPSKSTHSVDFGRYTFVPNGNFETELSGWGQQLDWHSRFLGAFHPSREKAFSGAGSACCVAVSDFSKTGYAFVSLPFELRKNKRYVLSAAFETSQMKTGTLAVDLSENSGPMRINARPGYDGWQFLWAEFEGWDGSANVRIIHDCEGTCGEKGFIDAVAVTPKEEFQPAHSTLTVSSSDKPELGSIKILEPGPTAGPINCLHVSETENRTLVLDNDGELQANTTSHEKIERLPKTGKFRAAAKQAFSFHPYGTHLAVIPTKGLPYVREIDNSKILSISDMPEKLSCVAWSPDGSKVALINDNGVGFIIRFPEMKRIGSINSFISNPQFIVWSHDSKSLVIGADSRIVVLNAETNEIIWQTVEHGFHFTASVWAKNNSRLFAGTMEGKILAWDMRVDMPSITVMAHEGRVNSVAMSTDGTRLASTGEDKSVAIWESDTLKKISKANVSMTSVRAVAFGPTSSNVYFGTQDGLVMRWEFKQQSDFNQEN